MNASDETDKLADTGSVRQASRPGHRSHAVRGDGRRGLQAEHANEPAIDGPQAEAGLHHRRGGSALEAGERDAPAVRGLEAQVVEDRGAGVMERDADEPDGTGQPPLGGEPDRPEDDTPGRGKAACPHGRGRALAAAAAGRGVTVVRRRRRSPAWS